MPVSIVTDSTADLPSDLVARYGIRVVPLLVQFGEEWFRDGVDLSPAAFYARLRTGSVLPTTSQPSLATFQATYEDLLKDGGQVVAIHLSSTFSGTYQASVVAARACSPGRVAVLDSRSLSMGTGWLALEAAQAAAAGAPYKEVVALVERLRPGARVMAVLETLEFLQRGGRIGRARAFLGSLLGIKPLLEVRDGEVLPRERIRTWGRAIERLVELTLALGKLRRVAVIHSGADQAAERLRGWLEPRLEHAELRTCELGPVLGTHIGPGAVGVAVLVDEP